MCSFFMGGSDRSREGVGRNQTRIAKSLVGCTAKICIALKLFEHYDMNQKADSNYPFNSVSQQTGIKSLLILNFSVSLMTKSRTGTSSSILISIDFFKKLVSYIFDEIKMRHSYKLKKNIKKLTSISNSFIEILWKSRCENRRNSSNLSNRIGPSFAPSMPSTKSV